MYDDEERILRKVRITEGMSNDGYLFVTDATNDELQEWANEVADAMYDGDDSYFLDWLSEEHFVKLLYDSELEIFGDELQEAIGWDVSIDVCNRPASLYVEEKETVKTQICAFISTILYQLRQKLRQIAKFPKYIISEWILK